MPGEVLRVSDILKAGGFCDFSHVKEDVMEAAQELGDHVHLATALDDISNLFEESVSEALWPYLTAWRKFKKDYGVSFKASEIEFSLTSTKWGFRGTPDRLPKKIGQKWVLIDIKTSTAMMPHVALQVNGGYKILCKENGYKVDEAWGIQLLPDGTYRVEPYREKTDESVFLGALQVQNWKRRHLKGKR